MFLTYTLISTYATCLQKKQFSTPRWEFSSETPNVGSRDSGDEESKCQVKAWQLLKGGNQNMTIGKMLSRSIWGLKIIMINMDLMEKVNNIQEQVSNVSRETEMLRKNQMTMSKIKITVVELMNAFFF